MISLVIGTDAPFVWRVTANGQPVQLENHTVTLYVENSRGALRLSDLVIEGNQVRATYPGAIQTRLGNHSLTLRLNEGQKGMTTVSVQNAFKLVEWSKDAGGENEGPVQVNALVFESELSFGNAEIYLGDYLTKKEAEETYAKKEDVGESYDDTALWKELENKVDKEEGKSLSTNDFTNALKEKLEGLENYDDAEISSAVEKLSRDFNALLGDNASASIESFNEIIAFLEGIEDSASLDAIVASIQKEIAKVSTNTDAKLTELSAEIGKKQDTITDLETIRSGAAKGATAIQEVKTINGQPIVGSGNIEIQGGSGASTDKQGVVSQTLTYNTADNTYSVSNVVRGSVPSFFIDLVTEAGASFNAESGYFSLNGIDNIAYDEMRQIYDCRTGYGTNSLLAVYDKTYTARTNFAAFRGAYASFANHEPTTIYTKYLGYQNASITKFALSDSELEVKLGSANNFDSFGIGSTPMMQSRLEEIIGIICVSNLTGSNNFFYSGAWHPWLTTLYLKRLKASIDLSGMPRLNEATILYMINNEKATAAITIKLHADAKAMADASEAIQSALENHANITLGV